MGALSSPSGNVREGQAPLQFNRRNVLTWGAGLGGLAVSRGADALTPLEADDGSPIRSIAAPDLGGLAGLPLLLRAGSQQPDLLLVEAFDYNCGHCRTASQGLEEIARQDERIGIVFLHMPILSAASMEAATIVAATLSTHGASAANALHRSLLALPGRADEAGALAAAERAGLERPILAQATTEGREAVLAQLRFARAGSLRFTPTFVLADRAFIGWPGVPTLQRFIAAARRCGALICPGGTRG